MRGHSSENLAWNLQQCENALCAGTMFGTLFPKLPTLYPFFKGTAFLCMCQDRSLCCCCLRQKLCCSQVRESGGGCTSQSVSYELIHACRSHRRGIFERFYPRPGKPTCSRVSKRAQSPGTCSIFSDLLHGLSVTLKVLEGRPPEEEFPNPTQFLSNSLVSLGHLLIKGLTIE